MGLRKCSQVCCDTKLKSHIGIVKPFLLVFLLNLFFSFVAAEGGKYDAGMIQDSGLLQDLENFAYSPDGRPMCIFGDPAYPLRLHLQAPFRNAVMTPQMEAFNDSMSTVRTSVEWLFGDTTNYFKFVDFKKDLKVQLSCVGKMYIVCALLRNALTCLDGNQTSSYFGVDPLSWIDYFS